MRPTASVRRTIALAAAGAIATLLAASSPASAAVPVVTAQAQAADAAFLAYAPPPPNGAGALCLVDTGVHSNPDTQPGLVSSSAIDGGNGDDSDPGGHGTTMTMIAGAAGNGMIGAWPQLKIVSVRATTTPPPGQEPTFEFDSYAAGMRSCAQQSARHVHAIDLALSSVIPPSPDQAQGFANEVAVAHGQNIAVLAAAGNQPGPVQEPAAEPGILAVGASTAQADVLSGGPPGSVCNFSASTGFTFYAPGCGLDEANPFTDQPKCCGNGTSQASAFAAAVLVALMSYDPSLSYSKAEQLLVSTTVNGNLDVAAAFRADNLAAIVAAGNANIPTTVPAPVAPSSAAPPANPRVVVNRLTWRRGTLTLAVSGLGRGERLAVQLRYARHRSRYLTSRRTTIHIRTARPRSIALRVLRGRHVVGRPITLTVT
jgi:hypothetical protein